MTIKKPNNRRHRRSGERSDSRISPAGSKRGDSGQARMTIVVSILVMAFFLRIYRLSELMMFIGDFAWFYISARDMLLEGNIPLIGITSSHTWVHQGPLWTYLLAIPLFVSNFNPVSGAYFTAALGTVTVYVIYKIGTQMFSGFVGLAAAALYATSPLVIIHSRMPYHTSLIPLVVLLSFLFLYKWIKGDIRYLPFVFLTLGILYNLELATMVFWILLLMIFVYGAVKKKKWLRESVRLKIILSSIFLFLLPMSPMIIYDLREHSGFYQMTAFFRLIKIYLFSSSQTFSFEVLQNVFSRLFSYNQKLVFLGSGLVAFFITIVSFANLFFIILRATKSKLRSREVLDRNSSRQARTIKSEISRILLALLIFIPLLVIVLSKTPSEAYVPMLFPSIILSIALLLNYMYKRYILIAVIAILFIVVTNSYLLVVKNYLIGTAGGYGLPFSKRLEKAKKIVNKSKGREYNLVGKEGGSEHKSFTMNYEYLTWWLGHPPSKNSQELKFVIEEK